MKKVLLAAVITAVAASSAFATATPDEAEHLGKDLLPWGAIKAGNKEGTIPAYGEKMKIPAGFDAKNPTRRPDPFGDEKPVLVITHDNWEQHKDKLPEGLQELFKKYPAFRMDVYPTHRTAQYPQYVQDNAIKNATACKTAAGELQIDGCFAGTPFPIPHTGAEVMWNRLLKYDQYSYYMSSQSAVLMDAGGTPDIMGDSWMWVEYPIYDPKKTTPIGKDDPYERLRIDWFAPARKDGEKLVVQDNVNMVDIGRRAWSYLPGQRRVKLSPDIAYDTPSPTGGGAATTDDSALFYGSIDRYNWKLLGKKEMYIPYNAFKTQDNTVCPREVKDKVKNFMNPDCMRFELHRVWVVEGELKPGKRHVYQRRNIVWDEDMPGVGVAANYDSAGKIFRVGISIPTPMYETQGQYTDQWVTLDLTSGAYVREQDWSTMKGSVTAIASKGESFYKQDALVGNGVR
jgi:hypothetical protein